MALSAFKRAFDNTYQEFFPKVLIAMRIANTRLQEQLTFGQSVDRVKYDISSVDVQDITVHTDMSIDSVTDTRETLTVDQWKGVAFPLAEKETVQAGPLNPGTVIGGQTAIKLATYVDADVLYETTNASQTFDTGDLTTLASTGTPITINATTTPQMATRMPAKLRSDNQMLQNMAFVVDSYGIGDIFQYLLGKDADFTSALFQNGYVNQQFASAEVFVSENLTGEAVCSIATNPTDGDTMTVNGVVFTFEDTLATAGGLHIGTTVDDTRANAAVAMNAIGTAIAETATTGYQVLSAADQDTWNNLRITATDSASADTLTIVGKGSGRLTVAETFTDGTDAWGNNFIHAYFGKKGAIDAVIQKDVKVDMRPEPKQPTHNVISRVLYGIKTFTDGTRKFLDVQISA